MGLHTKRVKILTVNFIYYLEKRDFFANDFKHRKLYTVGKNFISMSMNSRSLQHNNAPFGSDPLVKFAIFAQKSTLRIQALSVGVEGIILKRRLR